jgi:ATP-dependent DNA ligase
MARSCAPVETQSARRFIRPCEPVLVDRQPDGPGWLHEVKHDGFRVLALK